MAEISGIIPARYNSSRFPGKPLAKIGNKTMIEWTYSQSCKSRLLQDVIVATDDERIEKEVKRFGGKVMMTSTSHNTGTDRLIEVARNLPDAKILVNIQGDEPGIDPELIDGVVKLKKENQQWEMSSAAVRITNQEELKDPNRVKVVFDRNYKALYFSRSLIPSLFKETIPVFRHLGIYAYERNFLINYNSLPASALEKSESLEQLRAVEAGHSIGIFVTNHAGLAVDTPEDLENVILEFKKIGWI